MGGSRRWKRAERFCGSQVMEVAMQIFCPVMRCKGFDEISTDLTRGGERIPSFVGDAQGIEPIGGIGGQGEHHVGGGVAIVLV